MNQDKRFYFQIKSLTQLPEIEFSISPLPWKPCAVEVFKHYDQNITKKDPYFSALIRPFLHSNIICSDEICQNIAYCHPLYFALLATNGAKQHYPDKYLNEYQHPIPLYSTIKHNRQHHLKHFRDL